MLTAIQVLRPARDAIGMRGGLDEVRWLFIGTAVVTLGVNPMFGWLVSRFRRLVFISATYAFFALSLVGFYALIDRGTGGGGRDQRSRVLRLVQRLQSLQHDGLLGAHGRSVHA